MSNRGRKPKDWRQRWADSVRTATWANVVAVERNLPATGYALCKHFDQPQPGESLPDWNARRSRTWDRRLAGTAGLPHQSQFTAVSNEGRDSYRIFNHVMWQVPFIGSNELSVHESLMRRLNPTITRRFLPSPRKQDIWLDRFDLTLDAARWVSLEANLDAVAALLIVGRGVSDDEPELEIKFGMYAYAVLLRACAFEPIENTVEDIADVLFDHIRQFDTKPPSRHDEHFYPWIPSTTYLNVKEIATSNRRILAAIAPLILKNPTRQQLERLLYHCDTLPRHALINAVIRIEEENIHRLEDADDEIHQIAHQYQRGLQHSLYGYYQAWWMSSY